MNSGRKYLSPTIYFLLYPLNKTYSKKIFLPIFSKYFIHHISLPNKYTLQTMISDYIIYELPTSCYVILYMWFQWDSIINFM